MTNEAASPDCLVEQAVNHALGDAYREAEELLIRRLGAVSLAELSADFHRRLSRMKRKGRNSKDGL